MGRPPKRKPIQRKKKSDDKETSQRVQEKHIFSMTVLDRNEGDNKITLQTVVEKDTVPSTTLTNDEEGRDPDFVSCSESDYNITFTRRRKKVIGTIYWKVGKYYDLKPDTSYVCHLPRKEAKCCNVWKFYFKKGSFIYIGLHCLINDRNVTFSVLLGDKTYRTSSLLTVEATEYRGGTYSGALPYSTVERYEDELKQKFFTLKCEMILYAKDLTRSDYPSSMCSCSELTENFRTLYEEIREGNFDEKIEFNSAHKCILTARCPAFRKGVMLSPNKSPALSFLTTEKALEEEVFDQALRYIYTGINLPLTIDTAIHLFRFSDGLELPNLRKKCRRFLAMKLAKENFLEIHCLAVLGNSTCLQQATKAFFLENQDLMECIERDLCHRPAFVPAERFENIKSSLKELLESSQNLQTETIHDAN